MYLSAHQSQSSNKTKKLYNCILFPPAGMYIVQMVCPRGGGGGKKIGLGPIWGRKKALNMCKNRKFWGFFLLFLAMI